MLVLQMELYHYRRHLLVSIVSILGILQFTNISITDGVIPPPPPPSNLEMLQFTDIGIADGVVPPPPPAGIDSKYSRDASFY